VAVHPIRRGAMPADRVHHHRQQAQTRKREVNTGTTRPPQARRSSTRSGLNATPQNPGLHNVSVTWARQVVALTLSCAAGPDTWSMGTPAHTPPIGLTCASKGPGIHPSGRTHHLSREPCRQARTRGRGRRWQRGRQRNHPRRPGSVNPSMRSWALQVEHGQPRPHRHPRG